MLRCVLDSSGQIEVLELFAEKHKEYVPRSRLVEKAAESPDMRQSPNNSKATGKKAAQQRKQQTLDQGPTIPLPATQITDFGITRESFQFLEVSLPHDANKFKISFD